MSYLLNGDVLEKDSTLIKKILQGNLRAYRHLIDLHQRLVAHIVYRLVSNAEDQEEICQEVFIKVYQNLSKFKFESKLSTWIGRIAYNTTINYIRKEKLPLYNDIAIPTEKESEGEKIDHMASIKSANPTPEEFVESIDRNRLIHKQIENLPAPFRTILTLYHLEQLSYGEIGEIMNLPEGTVKSYLFRGRKKLKEVLANELQGEEI